MMARRVMASPVVSRRPHPSMAMTRTNPHRMTRKPPDRAVKGEVVVQVGPVRMPPAPERDGQPDRKNRPHRRATTDATKRNPRSRFAASGLLNNASAASNLAPMMRHPAGQWSLPARPRLSDALRCPPRIIAASERAKRSEEHTSELQSRQYLAC